MLCPHCGYRNADPGQEKCLRCGRDLKSAGVAPEPEKKKGR